MEASNAIQQEWGMQNVAGMRSREAAQVALLQPAAESSSAGHRLLPFLGCPGNMEDGDCRRNVIQAVQMQQVQDWGGAAIASESF